MDEKEKKEFEHFQRWKSLKEQRGELREKMDELREELGEVEDEMEELHPTKKVSTRGDPIVEMN